VNGLGASAAGRARPSWGDASHPAHEQLGDDIARIAESVRDVVGARATMVSRVADDEWLELMTVVGEPSAGIVAGLRWRREDLDRALANAEQLGRLHATKRHVLSYVEIPTSVPETERYIASHLGLLIAPLHSSEGHLLGVITTEGPVDIVHPAPGTCELVELYAGQARLALTALRDQDLLTERLRMSYAVQRILDAASVADDLAGLLDAVAGGLGEMMQARGAWACAELESGSHVDAASYPGGTSEGLGADVCTFLEPIVAASLEEERPLTDETAPLLGRLARVAGLDRALLAPIGDGTGTRGALLVLRASDDDSWSVDDHEAMFALGRRLGTVADQVRGRRRDHETVEELMRLDEYRRDLVASITHDLKTPLTAIALNTELLESDRRLAEAGSHPVEAIRRSADRLANLVDDLLAMARAEEGATQEAEVDLVEMVRDACGHAETEATLRGVTFEVVAPEELMATIDPHALARVFANLVSNAVKFSLPRGRVVLDLNRIGDIVEFRCSDDGIGIPQDRLDALFDLARRTPDSRTEELPGSGIGLAICERIVTRLGGEITVVSTQGQGSTFTVRVPC
jgi:signal transduction histidine kinase